MEIKEAENKRQHFGSPVFKNVTISYKTRTSFNTFFFLLASY